MSQFRLKTLSEQLSPAPVVEGVRPNSKLKKFHDAAVDAGADNIKWIDAKEIDAENPDIEGSGLSLNTANGEYLEVYIESGEPMVYIESTGDTDEIDADTLGMMVSEAKLNGYKGSTIETASNTIEFENVGLSYSVDADQPILSNSGVQITKLAGRTLKTATYYKNIKDKEYTDALAAWSDNKRDSNLGSALEQARDNYMDSLNSELSALSTELLAVSDKFDKEVAKIMKKHGYSQKPIS